MAMQVDLHLFHGYAQYVDGLILRPSNRKHRGTHFLRWQVKTSDKSRTYHLDASQVMPKKDCIVRIRISITYFS